MPDESFFVENGEKIFTNEYRETIDRVKNFALKNQTPSAKKIYFFYGRKQIGEERLAEYFRSKGYEFISPERLTLDEQLNILINAESFASTLGSCSHNSIFLREGTEVILSLRRFIELLRSEIAVRKFFGYVRTLKNYFRTPKGRHDFFDYARAVAIILFTSLIIFLLVRR